MIETTRKFTAGKTSSRTQPATLPDKTDLRSFFLNTRAFTLVELIMVMVLIGILAATAMVKWPTGMDSEAAAKELVRALRYAQHQAITREYDTAASRPWGLVVATDRYTIQRSDGSETATAEFVNRLLLDKPAISLTGPSIFFNGLGEPINAAGTPLTAASPRTYTIAGTAQVSVCPETGYVQAGPSCP